VHSKGLAQHAPVDLLRHVIAGDQDDPGGRDLARDPLG